MSQQQQAPTVDELPHDKLPREHLQEAVESFVKKSAFKQPRFDVRPACKPGDNFGSELYRVEVTDAQDKEKKLSLVVKSSFQNEAARQILDNSLIFRNEVHVYRDLLTAYSERMQEKGLLGRNDSYPDAPRCLLASASGASGTTEGTDDILILQDMKPEGFVLYNRHKGLDLDHCRLALAALARLHASSFVMEHLEPAKFERMRNGLGELFTGANEEFFMQAMEKPAVLKAWDMVEQRFPKGTPQYRKLQELSTIARKDFKELITPCPDGGNVICHGDYSVKNVMFKYSEAGKVERMCVLDFQTCRYASPVFDLSFFLFVFTEKGLRDAHLDALLRAYHGELQLQMRRLGVPDPDAVFSWARLQEHLRRYGRYAFYPGMVVIPLTCASLEETPDFISQLNKDGADAVGDAFTVRLKQGTAAERDRRMLDLLEDLCALGYM